MKRKKIHKTRSAAREAAYIDYIADYAAKAEISAKKEKMQ